MKETLQLIKELAIKKRIFMTNDDKFNEWYFETYNKEPNINRIKDDELFGAFQAGKESVNSVVVSLDEWDSYDLSELTDEHFIEEV